MKTFSFGSVVAGLCLLAISSNAFAWGQKGHDVTCAIAQKHLTPAAGQQVAELFDGKSLVYWANWMDNASHTPQYSFSKAWHYKNVDADQEYDTAASDSRGDVLTGIYEQIDILQNASKSKEQKALALKMLIHFVGDLHCPMHLGHRSDLGGNKWQVQFFNNGTNLHKVWDSNVLETAHKWSFTEWCQEIDTVPEEEIPGMTAGSPVDWGRETHKIATDIYGSTPVGSKLSYDYVSKWAPTVERQLLLGGLRLASILNGIFFQ